MKLCLCGCGQEVDEVHNYKAGHNFLTEDCKNKKKRSLHDPNFVKEDRKKRSNRLCKCGCGQSVTYKYAIYVKGHQNKNKTGHNRGQHWNIRDDSDKKLNGLSEEHKIKIGLKSKGHEVPQELRVRLQHVMKGNKKCGQNGERNYFYGKHYAGAKHPRWLGGKSFEPYSPEFNKQLKELIRMRDNYTCQLCGLPERESLKKLTNHHINYDKKNCLPNNLITLCNACNSKVNKDREHWQRYFIDLLKKRKLNKPYYQFKMENVNGLI